MAEYRYSQIIASAVHSNLAYDSEAYDFMNLYCDST